METVVQFMERSGRYAHIGQFSVYRVDEGHPTTSPLVRRDYYKISLITEGTGSLHYADRSVPVNGRALVFGNPLVPYAWECASGQQRGYYCLFTEDFVQQQLKLDSLAESPLFRVNGQHVLVPDDAAMEVLTGVFERMLTEMETTYRHKYDLLRSYTQVLMHEAMKLEPLAEVPAAGLNAARITDLFLQLLERQFPVTSPRQVVRLRNAGEFAAQLAIHTNHLNKCLRDTTGKSTSEHINGRFLKEAKALLQHSNFQAAEIGYSLGYEHDSNFNIFFKKQTGQTPKQFRKQFVG